MEVARPRGGVECGGEEVGDDGLAAVGREHGARRRLHPRVGDEDPQRAQARAEPHQPAGHYVGLGADLVAAEQQHAQEYRLQEEREQCLGGQRRAEDVAHEARVVGPVGAERELHGYAGCHAYGERGGEYLDPHARDAVVGSVFAAIGLRHEDGHDKADADGKQDGVVSTHQDGVADAGEGAHKGALGGVDDLGLHGLAVGLGLLESQGHAGDQGAQLGLGVEEGHVPGQSLGKALLIVAVQLLQGLGQGGAEGEAHHTLVVLAAVVEEGPVPCGLGYVLFGQLTHRSRPPQSKSDCCWPRRRPGWRCHCPWP